MESTKTAPLTGLRVLDLGTVYAAPIAAMLLGDYGAEVIKVEHPSGDPARTHGWNREGHGLWWKVIARNKRTVTLNIGKPDGQEILRRLVAGADVLKQTLGWTAPKLRDPHAADRWTWIVIAAHTQLRLARHLTQDLRRPWERPAPAGRLTPARVRRGFRNLRAKTTRPAGAPKPTTAGPGRPPGSKNRRPTTRPNVGKTTKRGITLDERKKHSG